MNDRTGDDDFRVSGRAKRARQGPRKPRKADAAYLERAALWYLERYAATNASLRRVLERKVERSARAHGTDATEGRKLIAELVVRFERAGLLDDRRFAENRARSLHERGASIRAIRAKLRAKGIDADLIDIALETLGEAVGDLNESAAIRYARRRRIGPYRTPGRREEMREKDLAAMARAGFDYETARRIVDAENAEIFEAVV